MFKLVSVPVVDVYVTLCVTVYSQTLSGPPFCVIPRPWGQGQVRDLGECYAITGSDFLSFNCFPYWAQQFRIGPPLQLTLGLTAYSLQTICRLRVCKLSGVVIGPQFADNLQTLASANFPAL